MSYEFDKEYWSTHWDSAHGESGLPPHPALAAEVAGLHPGTAVDAGSGEGAEAFWLAARGWDVTAVDISAHAVQRAATRFPSDAGAGSLSWVEADLTAWEPDRRFDLVTTFYAHPAIPQHAFYERISRWVNRGGTLLIVGHQDDERHGHGHTHPENAVTEPERVRALLDPADWVVRTAEIRERVVASRNGAQIALRDVVVRAERI